MQKQLREMMEEVWKLSDEMHNIRRQLMTIYSELAKKLHKEMQKERKEYKNL